MTKTLFLHSEVADPFSLYEAKLKDPVSWDNSDNLWAIYSYQSCKEILSCALAQIPETNPGNTDGLNEYALLISGKLARLNNGIRHEAAKHAVLLLLDHMKAAHTGSLIDQLIEMGNNKGELDWVASICKKLPLMLVLKCFDFNDADCNFIVNCTEQLTKIMLPVKTPGQVIAINEISRKIYHITEKHLCVSSFYKPLLKSLSESYHTNMQETLTICVSNLIGLFIQGYDAGRGILSNTLLQLLNNGYSTGKNSDDKTILGNNVVETLRFDPPVHNTRRIAVDNILMNNIAIKKGQSILIILAAANRDPRHFNNPNIYNTERLNNRDHLAFGIGSHRCPANHISVKLATDALHYLFEKYKTIRLIEKTITYEPIINVRLPRQLFISLY
ncbi:MAG: cytochrome P450 [Ginsengibacter sp.]